MSRKVAVVTGSNKGLGLAIVKGLCERFPGDVYLTSRDVARGQVAVAALVKQGLAPRFHQLDVTDRASITELRNHLEKEHGGLDLLVNNAAVADSVNLFNSYEECENIMNTNYRSVLTIQELLFPLMREHGRVVNISSDCGHLSNIRNEHWIRRLASDSLTVQDINEFVDWFLKSVKDGTFNKEDFADGGTVAAYRVAKVALSAVTRLQQRDLEGRGISVNSMHPGLVRTDMTHGVGFLSAEEAARTPLHLALDAPATLRGAYVWYDRKVIDWYDYKADWYFKTSTLKPK
ncbi:unnamed protein product [Plutella xylostella]|uniref:carbonyl reductase (NADPH) n=1 Tax=Plutella xylostella TaxID=51655 RepID=A0A8S4F098_PLUXY|nr:unnamed protein product [Plutella xylostella]